MIGIFQVARSANPVNIQTVPATPRALAWPNHPATPMARAKHSQANNPKSVALVSSFIWKFVNTPHCEWQRHFDLMTIGRKPMTQPGAKLRSSIPRRRDFLGLRDLLRQHPGHGRFDVNFCGVKKRDPTMGRGSQNEWQLSATQDYALDIRLFFKSIDHGQQIFSRLWQKNAIQE